MSKPRILVIEDETVVAMDIERGLKSSGFDVVATAGTGEQAIRLAGHHRPDLVLMDIRLQGPMDGIEAGQTIRKQFGIPIVFLTAYADASTVQRSKVAEPFGYLLKPFEDSELNSAIEIALYKRAAEEKSLKLAGEALWLSEERFRLLVDGLKDYSVTLLDPQGRIMTWNPGAQRLQGYTEKEIIGQHFSIFYPPDDVVRNKPNQLLWAAAHAGRAEEDGWRLRKDGSRFWGDVLVTALHNKEGDFVGFSKVTRDITEQKKAEAEIRELNATLEQRVRERTQELMRSNRELKAFTYSVAHDLRGPLRGIRAYLSILEDMGSGFSPEAIDFLARSSACADRMGKLIDDLLNLAQVGQQRVQFQPVDLNKLIVEVKSDLEPGTKLRQIEWHIHPLPTVACDPGLTRQVFANLLENAIKYTSPREHAIIEAGTAQKAGETAFFIRDNGVGFDMKYADKLFKPFSRLHTTEQFQGTGIGLAIVERVVARHGGRTWAEAQIDKGATFFFTLGDPRAKTLKSEVLLDAKIFPTNP